LPIYFFVIMEMAASASSRVRRLISDADPGHPSGAQTRHHAGQTLGISYLEWNAMQKIAIVGSGGSGKSHVARKLAAVLDLPVIHLDAVYFDDEWNALPMEKFAQAQCALVAAPRWVIDGNYNSTLAIRLKACDTVIFMDISTLAALWGIVSRQIRDGAGHQGNGVHNRITWDVLKYIATYRRQMRPRVLAKIHEYASGHAEVVLLTSRRRTRRWLRQVTTTPGG
jgi:adenylate kinase family enzyme